ncbi:MAG: Thiamine-phosphate synthase [Phycisphaerae bacterium]|nr:Thiamine-phosphate synthase [Phycisphaerae bacterium]
MTDAILRILDVNLNRLREALRVLEDHARFACDDAAAAGGVKALRHALNELRAQLGGPALLAARGIESDVGRELKTAAELSRESADDVAAAAFARAAEAARALGEFGKMVSPEAAAGAEALRYRLYALEPRVRLRSALAARFRRSGLYVIVTEALCRRPWRETAEEALLGGAGCVQLREKGLTDGELLSRARELRELTARHGALFIMNDRPDIARLAGADGVHVGQDDLPVREARRIASGGLLVGVSTHTIAQFEAALRDEPDYVAVGPMFPSGTKPQEHVAGVETLAAVRGLTDLPLVAIGGIEASNATRVRQAGADVLCVCAAVIQSDDPRRAARELGSVR